MNETLKIVVPLTPPSVNHYMKYRVAAMKGRATVVSYPSREAKEWWKAVAIAARGSAVDAKGYEISYVVYQGNNERGDVDNYAKCLLDALVKAQVIDSDHKVFALHAYKSRDRDHPRTEIFIRSMGQLSLIDPPMPIPEAW